MASIQVSYPHQRTMADAREAVQAFSGKLEAKLGVKSHWEGDRLKLERPGVVGLRRFPRRAWEPELQHQIPTQSMGTRTSQHLVPMLCVGTKEYTGLDLDL